MRKKLKHHLIVNLSYKLTKQLIELKIYSETINDVVDSILDQTIEYYNITNKDVILHLTLREIDSIIEANDFGTLISQIIWENTPEGFAFWSKIYWENE